MFIESDHIGYNPVFARAVRAKRAAAARSLAQSTKNEDSRIAEEHTADLRAARRAEQLRLASEARKARAAEREAFRQMKIWKETREQQMRAREAVLARQMATAEFDWIFAIAMHVFCLSRDEIVSPYRSERSVLARQFIMYWARRRTSLSFPQIGRNLRRDHTSCIHGASAYVQKRAAMGRTLRPVR